MQVRLFARPGLMVRAIAAAVLMLLLLPLSADAQGKATYEQQIAVV